MIVGISACTDKIEDLRTNNILKNKWYNLASPTDIVIAEFKLKPGEIEYVEVITDKITVVGFIADISKSHMEKYQAKNIMPITVEYKAEKLTMHGFGGGQAVMPQDGKILLKVTNHSNEERLVDIFRGKSYSKDDMSQ